MNISRRTFVQGAAASINAAGKAEGSLQTTPFKGPDDIYPQLVDANERAVDMVLGDLPAGQRAPNVRRIGANLEALAAAFRAPESPRHNSAALIDPLEKVSASLLNVQHRDGTIDSGNLSSPPDTGFVLEVVCIALSVLCQSGDARLAQVQEKLKNFILRAGDALVTGGIHTPNHRWVVSSALARVNSLFPDAKYVERIDDWLGEGIYIPRGLSQNRSQSFVSSTSRLMLLLMCITRNARRLC